MELVTVGGEQFRIQQAVVVVGSDGQPLAPGSLSGDASAANQAAVQADAGSNASKATSVQGITGGKAIPITGTEIASLNTAIGAKTDAAWDGVAASASVISLLKAIALNTTPAP